MPNFRVPAKVFVIVLNRPTQLICQYFPSQLIQVSLFANILPLQNFPMYGILLTLIHSFIKQIIPTLYQELLI